jgi:hypothetical protein
MNTPFALCMRLTHGYQARYSYLEKSHNMGECQVIAGRERKWDRHGESFRQLLILSVNTGSTPYRQRNIIRAIEDTQGPPPRRPSLRRHHVRLPQLLTPEHSPTSQP